MTPENYFKRQIALWGEKRQHRLAQKKIAIIGSGGLGCSLAMALGTSGIGVIDVVDFDTVSYHNIHRQIGFTLKDEGRNKAEVVVELIKSKNPFLKAEAFTMDFNTFSKQTALYDMIVDATDNLPAREQIDNYAKEHKVPWVYGSVEEFNGQVCFFDEADFQVFALSDHIPGGIAAPMVMHIGSLQANLALRYLAGLPVMKDKLYYLYFSPEGELVTQKFGMPKA